MSQPIAFYYDFVSPYSYFAFTQRGEIEAKTGRVVKLLPVSVGMVMDKVGNAPTSVTCKTKQKYLRQDIARWVGKLRVPFAPHPLFGKFSTAPLIKAALCAGDELPAFSQAAFEAVWVEQAPLDDEAAMGEFFAAKSASFAHYWAARDSRTNDLVARVDEAVTHGVFGVPYFHTEKGDFFGNDRLDFVVEAFAK